MAKDPNELNLVPAIKEVEAQIRKIKAEYSKKLQPYEDSLEQLRKINTACERCNGVGKVLRPRACAEDDPPDPNDPCDWNKCDECKGTGLAHWSSYALHKKATISDCEHASYDLLKDGQLTGVAINVKKQCFG